VPTVNNTKSAFIYVNVNFDAVPGAAAAAAGSLAPTTLWPPNASDSGTGGVLTACPSAHEAVTQVSMTAVMRACSYSLPAVVLCTSLVWPGMQSTLARCTCNPARHAAHRRRHGGKTQRVNRLAVNAAQTKGKS
jgi:hypothetical protein